MILHISCFMAVILLIWFRTDAVLEYARWAKISGTYEDFDKKKESDITLTLHTYLRKYHSCFFIRLITCPVCVSVWLGILCGLIVSPMLIPTFIIGGLFIFLVIDRLLG